LSPKKKLRLIHTSDTHLGGDWHPDLAEAALATIVDGVSRLGGDALLIVGDVFDHARVPDRVLEFFVDQMRRIDVPVLVLPGNHDLYDAGSLYLRAPFAGKPDNLHIFNDSQGQVISIPSLTLDLWGRAMPLHTPEFRPLAGMPPNGNGHWLVALAHGHFHFENDTDRRSSPIFPHEIAEASCDYLALGHWERHIDVSQGPVKAVYSGSPLGAFQNNHLVSVTVVDLDPETGVQTHQATLSLAG
jgi:DNA repair exonuclease SbcCD nuclease subunit